MNQRKKKEGSNKNNNKNNDKKQKTNKTVNRYNENKIILGIQKENQI